MIWLQYNNKWVVFFGTSLFSKSVYVCVCVWACVCLLNAKFYLNPKITSSQRNLTFLFYIYIWSRPASNQHKTKKNQQYAKLN